MLLAIINYSIQLLHLKSGIYYVCLIREHVAKINPKIIPGSSSKSSKFKYDEFAGFESNTVRSQMQKNKEEELCFYMVQKYNNWHSAARWKPETLFAREEIQEFKTWLKLKKNYQGQEIYSRSTDSWYEDFLAFLEIFLMCEQACCPAANP